MTAQQILKQIKTSGNFRLRGDFHLTKAEANFSDALVVRDSELEINVHAWLTSRTSYTKIFSRYRNYDSNFIDESFPQHYPVRLMAGTGSICSGQNIFMFFPNVMGGEPRAKSEVFGLEFVDVWSNIFRKTVFPIVRKTFGEDMWLELFSLQRNLEKTIYLASVFHEIGHRTGPFRISPARAKGLKIDQRRMNILGELSTDCLLVQHLVDFPEILHFVIFQRLFWFGRMGFRNNPIQGNLNQDNDCWIGGYLWNKMVSGEVLVTRNGKLSLDSRAAQQMFKQITIEIDQLYRPDLSAKEQNEIVDQWMQENVEYKEQAFVLSAEFRKILGDIQEIPETPHFETPYNYSQIENLLEVSHAVTV
jgi:hypothetical protein